MVLISILLMIEMLNIFPCVYLPLIANILAIEKIELFVLLFLSCKNYLHIQDISTLSHVLKIFSPNVWCFILFFLKSKIFECS